MIWCNVIVVGIQTIAYEDNLNINESTNTCTGRFCYERWQLTVPNDCHSHAYLISLIAGLEDIRRSITAAVPPKLKQFDARLEKAEFISWYIQKYTKYRNLINMFTRKERLRHEYQQLVDY